MKSVGVSILILFSVIVQVRAIDDNTKFKHITVDNGLPQSNIACIFQDSKGFMWFGTKLGVALYNSYSYQTFTYDPGDKYSLTNNQITDIEEDKFHNIWIATLDGISRYNPSVNKFFTYYLPGVPNQTVIFDLYKDLSGQMWMCTPKGVFHYNYEKDTIQQLLTSNKELFKQETFSVLEDSRNNVWFGGSNGIYRLNRQLGNTVVKIKTEDPGLDSLNHILQFLEGPQKELWILTSGGLYKYNPVSETYKLYSFPFDKRRLRLHNKIMRGMILDNNGNLLIGTYYGILVFNPNTSRFIRISHKTTEPNSLSDNSVHSIFKDSQGDIWIGTSSGGLNYVKSTSLSFTHYNNKPLDVNSLASNIVNSFYEDSNGDIYIGTSRAGLNKLDLKNNKFSFYFKELNVRQILKKDEDNIWIATLSRGLILYNIRTGTIKEYRNRADDITSVSSNMLNCLFYDRNNNLWIGASNGLNKFDEKNNSFSLLSLSLSNNVEPFVNTINEIRDDVLWVGTSAGIFEIDIKTNMLTKHFTHIKGNTFCIPSNIITEVLVDKESSVWVGTENGLSLYLNNDKFKNYYTRDGLPANCITSIIEDNNGHFWIGTSGGLSKFDPNEFKFTNYDHTNGLQSNEFRKGSRYKCRNGTLLFGGVNGFNIFHPDSITIDAKPSPVYVTGLSIFDKPYVPEKSDDNSGKQFPDIKKVVLNYKQAVFTIHFLTIDYNYPDKNEYKYKMIGVDKSWNYVSNQRHATYVHLNPGKYEFIVQGSNSVGVWNNEGASLQIVILPPFWRTTWFYIICGITFVLAIILIYRLRFNFLEQQKKQLRNKVVERTKELNELNVLLEEQKEEISQQNLELYNHREQLEKLVQERTRELETAKLKAEESDRLKTAFLTNMSHEIRTPMHAIIGFSGLLNEAGYSKEEQKEFIDQIKENSKSLLVLIDDIIDFSLLEAKKLSFKYKPINLYEFINSFAQQYIIKNLKPSIEFKLNVPENNRDLVFTSDPIRLKQVLNNLILNAYKFTEEGEIELGYTVVENSVVRFFVKDTGIGIEEKNIELIFDRFRKVESTTDALYRGAGLGLAISKSLVEALGGEILVESEKGRGSIFYFTIPLDFVEDDHGRGIKKLMTNVLRIKNRNILIAEDEESNFFFLIKALKNTEANVIRAKDGQEAIDIARSRDIDLVLMDIKMPIMDGYEATENIKKFKPNLPIIALSAYDVSEERLKKMHHKFDGYYNKPISVKELMGALSKFFPHNS